MTYDKRTLAQDPFSTAAEVRRAFELNRGRKLRQGAGVSATAEKPLTPGNYALIQQGENSAYIPLEKLMLVQDYLGEAGIAVGRMISVPSSGRRPDGMEGKIVSGACIDLIVAQNKP
jgi:hypothetical protein